MVREFAFKMNLSLAPNEKSGISFEDCSPIGVGKITTVGSGSVASAGARALRPSLHIGASLLIEPALVAPALIAWMFFGSSSYKVLASTVACAWTVKEVPGTVGAVMRFRPKATPFWMLTDWKLICLTGS